MVMEDGQLVEMDINTVWQLLFFQQLSGGSYAVYRTKWKDLSILANSKNGKTVFAFDKRKICAIL